MMHSKADAQKRVKEGSLSRRDWIVLPLISLLTIGVLTVSTEAMGTLLFPRAGNAIAGCIVANDPSAGVHGKPDSVCVHRLSEGPPIEYRFNSCGDRAGMECGAKPPGTYRIVMAGSSIAMGFGAPIENTIAAQLSPQLSQRTGRRVEVYNKGLDWVFPPTVDLRFKHVLADQPDMVLWIITPIDVARTFPTSNDDITGPAGTTGLPPGQRPGFLRKAWAGMNAQFAGKSIPDALSAIADETRTVFLIRHFMYESQSLFVQSYLLGGDDAGFLKSQPSEEWQGRLQHIDAYAADMARQARAAGVPLVVVLVPNRAQASMISMGKWPAGFSPYKLDDELRNIATSHGATYVDILQGFRGIPNPEQYFLPADGHPNDQGYSILSGLLANALTNGSVPDLREEPQPPATQLTARR